MRASIWLRRILPAMSSCMLMIAVFGRLPLVLVYGVGFTGLGMAAYTIVSLVRVYRNGNDPIDYTGWTEPADDEPQPKLKSDSTVTVDR